MLYKSGEYHFEIVKSNPYPLGTKIISKSEKIVNFAVFSETATGMCLCIYDKNARNKELACVRMFENSKHIWHVALKGIECGQLYAYRAYGLFNPDYNMRFNPNKLLLDPYAKAYDQPAISHQNMVDVIYEKDNFFANIPEYNRDQKDSAPLMPRSVVIDDNFDWQNDKAPKVPWHQTIIYEMHVKGFSKLMKGIRKELRGTFAGLANQKSIDYLTSLGITSVQLMPVHYHCDDLFLVNKNLSNYWGYSTIGFFAPEIRYCYNKNPQEGVKEFKGMVKALHKAGIEVILDVVYNHSGEGGINGPTFSFRGLDNTSYYKISDENPKFYKDFTGCGNTFNIGHSTVLALVLDSLRYWVKEMHIDGFRFDLAVSLGRDGDKYTRSSSFFKSIYQDPILSNVKLLAEPWDLGFGGYQIGNSPRGWSELNGKYRDTVRSFWRGNDYQLPKFSGCITGSEAIYAQLSKPPQASINFITSHDGFTLTDLVSYDNKHNFANGEANRDGDNNNHSWNCGQEGPTNDPEIQTLRRRMCRNFLATLIFSQGIPFISAGDELGKTQQGNNNAYCQDNKISWLNWKMDFQKEQILEFVKKIIHIRKIHPVFQRRKFFNGNIVKGDENTKDIIWYDAHAQIMTHQKWHMQNQKAVVAVLCGQALAHPKHWRKFENDNDFLLAFNGHSKNIEICIPPGINSKIWQPLVDTSTESGFFANKNKIIKSGEIIPMISRSMLLLKNIVKK